MRIGSLFDGIGGFPLAASRYGIIPVWASEIEPFPVKVTQKHFPDMRHLGDITQINGAEIDPVDVITFGSPCQDLSVAGKREGLSGERSGLFSHAVRIIREMRAATDGKFPRFAVWENVPGAFSSNKGQDFRAVIEEIAETEIPMPRSGKWATAGVVRTERVDIAWRVLDAQYWGVPQRRKRIFLVCDFRGECAGEILFVEEGLSGDIAESGEAREEVAGDTGTGVDRGQNVVFVPTVCAGFCGKASVGASTVGYAEELAPTLRAGQEMHVLVHPEITGTLCASGAELNRPAGQGNETDLIIAYPIPANCLKAKGNLSHRDDSDTLVSKGLAVRRLIPLECERLMGFPDGWTDIPGASDTAKYKAIGNSVAIVCVDFIMAGIAEVLLCG